MSELKIEIRRLTKIVADQQMEIIQLKEDRDGYKKAAREASDKVVAVQAKLKQLEATA